MNETLKLDISIPPITLTKFIVWRCVKRTNILQNIHHQISQLVLLQ